MINQVRFYDDLQTIVAMISEDDRPAIGGWRVYCHRCEDRGASPRPLPSMDKLTDMVDELERHLAMEHRS